MNGFRQSHLEGESIHFIDRISSPVIVFQGLDDPIVPPAQAELIVAALRERGTVHEYHAYEGESHGFRRAETVIACLEAELSFYGQILGFGPPGIPAVNFGEAYTKPIIDYLEEVVANGGFVEGAADPSLDRLRVVAE